MQKISFIAPCYNEEENISEFYKRVKSVAREFDDFEFEFVIVNDGSHDESETILDKLADIEPRLVVIHLAQNMGHQTALFAGIEAADGDINITLDIDLQDPPEMLAKFLEKIEQGYEIVHAQRSVRNGETVFKILTAKFFYKFIKLVSKLDLIDNSGDFRAFTKPVRIIISQFREKHKFLRGLFVLVGFAQTSIKYERHERLAGETKYTLAKMIRLAVDATLNFSHFPIHLMFVVSSLMWSLSLLYLFAAVLAKFVFGTAIQGWTSIVFLQVFFAGVLLFFIALLGAYIGRIYEQGQDRPLYWIRKVRNYKGDK
ncbi:glycosyltransferase, group 2 family protein [Shewanella sediminis HAW-EB3]|uniref:Glycosyltransferase, group 2 family protein n=1 Tax=Shewanella sediminis (strain HAW-EB3) TaxID=425104 RepID=A8FVW7_SHESH|nr:glycosyltransferase family 2 protein [Shewanella sediminis]ABV36990.1 glycosyltransferase, group 2 family protein [Shewanella sediminis HAW-EB3]